MAKTLIGTATTDANGVATITYTATGADDVTIQAESGNLSSETHKVQDIYFYRGQEYSLTKSAYFL